MKIRLALLAVLAAAPVMAQAETTPRRQQARQAPAAPAAPSAPSGWTIPMAGFADAFNQTARGLNLEIRAVEKDCADRGTPVRTCAWQIGGHVSAMGAMRGDRTMPEDWTLSIDQAAGVPAGVELMTAMTVMLSYLEPAADQGERRAAFTSLFPPRPHDGLTEAKLRSTRFSVTILPRSRTLAGISRADEPQRRAQPIAVDLPRQ